MDINEIIKRLEACNSAMEYAAFNYDGSKLENLQLGIIESTGVSDSLLIEVRNNKILIEELKGSLPQYRIVEYPELEENEILEYKDGFGYWYRITPELKGSRYFQPFQIRKRKIEIPKEQWGVHEHHCCIEHCKYGDKDCPVVNGLTSGISVEEFEKGF
jgi:hypothetical protein